MKVVILGATRGMGRSLSRLFAENGHDVFLLGIGEEELQASATDVKERALGAQSKAQIGYAVCDLERPETFAPALDAATQTLGGMDTVIVTAGLFGTQDRLEQDLEFTRRLLTVNFAHTVLFCEHARTRLLARGGGTLC